MYLVMGMNVWFKGNNIISIEGLSSNGAGLISRKILGIFYSNVFSRDL
jgi:hypothetical protein